MNHRHSFTFLLRPLCAFQTLLYAAAHLIKQGSLLATYCGFVSVTLAAASDSIPRAAAPGLPATVEITLDQKQVGMGRAVTVHAQAKLGDGKPAANCELLPYVNGHRWGAHEKTDAQGAAVFHIPLPRVGKAEICVAAMPPITEPDDFWIWPGPQNVVGPAWMQKTFALGAAPLDASLWVAVDDGAAVFINGSAVAQKGGWTNNAPVAIPDLLLRAGENVISVEAINGGGPSGLLLRLDLRTANGPLSVVSAAGWKGFATKPAEWPLASASAGQPVEVIARVDKGGSRPMPWPSMKETQRMAGAPLDRSLVVSAPTALEVHARQLQTMRHDPEHLIAIQWEEWFTPSNAYWQTAHAVPLMGFYDSSNPDVARQHLIWLIESGVDCLIADWSNNIWFAETWAPGLGVMELIGATRVMMDEMARMRAEGHPVPKMTFLTGVSHVRPNGPKVVNAQLDYIWTNFVTNPKYAGLWQEFDGKPLVQILDLTASYLKEGFELDPRFTVRYTGAQLDITKTNELGLWSWLDWQRPTATRKGNVVEAMTVSVGTFGEPGWLDAGARGRRNGATLIEDWNVALQERPRFLQVHQFQEFAGNIEGQPAAPPNRYFDSYSPELSDDIEPTSLTAHAYRGQGGWGFYALNLLRALADLHRQPAAETTVVAIAKPLHRQVVSTDAIEVEWVEAGRPAESYTLSANGIPLAEAVKGSSHRVDLTAIPDGPVTLRIAAQGTRTRYRLAWTEEATRLADSEPASMEVTFTLKRRDKAK
jgi:hypothetical protein